MKRYKFNWYKIKIYIISIVFIIFSGYVFSTVRKIKADEPAAPDITTDILLNGNGEYANGYNHGTVYSIDGKPISYDAKIIAGKEKYMRHSGIDEFTPILGIEGFGSGGLINQCDITLHSAARNVNVELREGNSIQTTFSYKAQCVASSLLKQYFPSYVCKGASLAVVLKDGSVIVAAGSNAYNACEFNLGDCNTYPEDMCIDKTAENFAIGSSAKTFTSAALLFNDSYVDEEYSMYNPEFLDLSFYVHGGHCIENHDRYDTGEYSITIDSESNQMARCIGLEDAFVHSSNTYFWRHALNFGLDKTFNAINNLFSVTQPIVTEINTLTVLESDPERYDYLFWGQDWVSNGVSTSYMYNSIFSGEKYMPFYITSVYTPDGNEVYRADPQNTKTIPFDSKMKNILISSLSKCFKNYCRNIDPSVYEKYNKLIENNRILAKSGTADVVVNEITNHTRVVTLLDENHDVICTATIGVNRATNHCTVDDNIMFSIIFNTLEAAGIL
ncbi:MAG: hypothetical protein K2I00_01535 [Ruminococcus sp.]|nr:hypothetical protein [Ruminococcus sp.]